MPEDAVRGMRGKHLHVTVLGVDLSLAACGLAVYDGELRLVGTVRPTRAEAAERRRVILDYVRRTAGRFGVNRVCMERVRLFHQARINFNTIVALVALSTTLEDWAYGCLLPVLTVPTQTWKRAVLGCSRATKADAVAFVRRELGREVGHDAADAVCLAIYGWREAARGVAR